MMTNIHPKVAIPLVGNAVVTILIWIAVSQDWTRTPTPEVTAALITVVSFVLGYLAPSSSVQP